MMGSQGGEQEQLFYSFSLEDHVPKDHLLRGIDRFLDLSELRGQLASFYSHTGRPSIDPVLMIRMLVIGYSFGIRSERRLCDEVHLNLCTLAIAPRSRLPFRSPDAKEGDAFPAWAKQQLMACRGPRTEEHGAPLP